MLPCDHRYCAELDLGYCQLDWPRCEHCGELAWGVMTVRDCRIGDVDVNLVQWACAAHMLDAVYYRRAIDWAPVERTNWYDQAMAALAVEGPEQ